MNDSTLDQNLKAIAYWVRKSAGFNPESIGWSTFREIIKQRMKACAVDDVVSYSALLEHSILESNALIESIVIPETWFFRDPNAFYALKQFAITWRNNAQGPLRILSIPCASGEEPYSIAITLREVGFNNEQFQIDAVDVSTMAIAKAIQGVYTENAFRNNSLDFLRDQYFTKTDQGYKLLDKIRNDVSFNVKNFFMYYALLPYDIIFCRNLLIYFDQEMRAQAFAHLHNMLRIKGLLLLGHSELIQASYYGWKSTLFGLTH